MSKSPITICTTGKFAAGNGIFTSTLNGQEVRSIQLQQQGTSVLAGNGASFSDKFGESGASGRPSTRTHLINLSPEATLEGVLKDIAAANAAGATIYARISPVLEDVLSPGMLRRIQNGEDTREKYVERATPKDQNGNVIPGVDFFRQYYYAAGPREDVDMRVPATATATGMPAVAPVAAPATADVEL